MNTKTLLMLLLCGVCLACNAPQQDGQKTDLIMIKSIRLGLQQFGSPKIQEELTETHYIR